MKKKIVLFVSLIVGVVAAFQIMLKKSSLIAQPQTVTSLKFNEPALEQAIRTISTSIKNKLLNEGILRPIEPISFIGTIRNKIYSVFNPFSPLFENVERNWAIYTFSDDIAQACAQEVKNYPLETSLENASLENIALVRSALEGILYLAINTFFEYRLSWCDCQPFEKRIALALRIVFDIRQRYAPTDHIVYTSLASGSLLQDYIIIKYLKNSGFNSLEINFIDPGYLDTYQLNQLTKFAKTSFAKEHASFLSQLFPQEILWKASETTEEKAATKATTEKVAEAINPSIGIGASLSNTAAYLFFKKEIEALGISIKTYDSAYSYIARVTGPSKSAEAEKTDVLVMADVDTFIYTSPPYPSEAEIIALELRESTQENEPTEEDDDEEEPFIKAPSFMIFVPRDRGIQVYTNKDLRRFRRKLGIMNDAQKLLAEIVTRVGAQQKYSPLLIQEIIKKFKVLEKNLGGPAFSIAWYSDPHLAFQALIKDSLRDAKTAIVYILSEPNPLEKWRGKTEVQKINPAQFLQSDVIQTQKGRILVDDHFKNITNLL